MEGAGPRWGGRTAVAGRAAGQQPSSTTASSRPGSRSTAWRHLRGKKLRASHMPFPFSMPSSAVLGLGFLYMLV